MAGCDTSQLLAFVEEALDAIALLVEFGTAGTLNLSVIFGRDDECCSTFGNPVAQMIGIIPLVGKGGIGLEALDEVMGKSDVAAVSGRDDQPDWKAERFRRGMDSRAQSAARPTQALGIRPPFTLPAPAACW